MCQTWSFLVLFRTPSSFLLVVLLQRANVLLHWLHLPVVSCFQRHVSTLESKTSNSMELIFFFPCHKSVDIFLRSIMLYCLYMKSLQNHQEVTKNWKPKLFHKPFSFIRGRSPSEPEWAIDATDNKLYVQLFVNVQPAVSLVCPDICCMPLKWEHLYACKFSKFNAFW